MLADECANVSLEITKEGVIVLAEIMKILIPVAAKGVGFAGKSVYNRLKDIEKAAPVVHAKGEMGKYF